MCCCGICCLLIVCCLVVCCVLYFVFVCCGICCLMLLWLLWLFVVVVCCVLCVVCCLLYCCSMVACLRVCLGPTQTKDTKSARTKNKQKTLTALLVAVRYLVALTALMSETAATARASLEHPKRHCGSLRSHEIERP